MRGPLRRAQQWAFRGSGRRDCSTGSIHDQVQRLRQLEGLPEAPLRSARFSAPAQGLLTCVGREGGVPWGPLGCGGRRGRHAGGCGPGLRLHLGGGVGHRCGLLLPVCCNWRCRGEKKREVKQLEGRGGQWPPQPQLVPSQGPPAAGFGPVLLGARCSWLCPQSQPQSQGAALQISPRCAHRWPTSHPPGTRGRAPVSPFRVGQRV